MQETKKRTLKIGQHVKVADEYGHVHDGLVTNVWGMLVPGSSSVAEVPNGVAGPAINVLYVVDDPGRTDPYGHQIERMSSTSHKLSTTAPGRYWYFADESF